MALSQNFLQSWLWVLPILNWVWFWPEHGFLLTPARFYNIFLTGKTIFRGIFICASRLKSGDWAKTPIFQWSNSTCTASVCTCGGGQVLKNLTMEAEQGPGIQPGLPQVRTAHLFWTVFASNEHLYRSSIASKKPSLRLILLPISPPWQMLVLPKSPQRQWLRTGVLPR